MSEITSPLGLEIVRKGYDIPQTNERVHPDRVHGFIIKRSAAVEITILLDEREGIACPVFATGLHYIEMAKQQQRLESVVRARQHGDQPAVLGMLGDRE